MHLVLRVRFYVDIVFVGWQKTCNYANDYDDQMVFLVGDDVDIVVVQKKEKRKLKMNFGLG